MLAGVAIYAFGLVYYATRDNVASNDLRRFWPVLVFRPLTAPPGWINSALKRM